MTSRPDARELDAFIADIPFFASLDEITRRQLAEQLEPMHVAAGDVVVAEGSTGDGLYVVVSGRLRVSVAASGRERVLRDLARGAIVGEIALVSDRPRSATVRAVRDSDLLLLRVSSFKMLIQQNPAVLGPIARLLVDRLLTVDRPQSQFSGCRAIAVVAAGRDASAAAMVAERLSAQLARAGTVFRVDADVVAGHLGRGAAQRGPAHPGRAELTGWLHAVERSNDWVVYQPDAADTVWSRLCLSQSDVVLLTAAAFAAAGSSAPPSARVRFGLQRRGRAHRYRLPARRRSPREIRAAPPVCHLSGAARSVRR